MSREVPEGWKFVALSDVADIFLGQSPSSSETNEQEIGLPFFQGNGEFGDRYPTPRRWALTGPRLADKGDILISVRAPVGELNVAPGRCVIGRGLGAIRARNVDSSFLWHALHFSAPQLHSVSQGSTFDAVNRGELSKLTLPSPPLHEQRRIAEILSSVDEAIAATRAVIEQTRKVKQGVLERLLTKGIGHTRFKQTEIGEIPEGWEVKQVGQFARFQPGYAFKSAEFADSGVRLLRGSNVGVGSFDWSEGATKYFPAERVNEFSEYLLGENDIIIAMDRPFISAGFKVARLKKSDLPCLLLQRVGRLTPTGECDPDWLWQITSAGSVRRHLEKQQVGTDLPHISRSDIESCMVALPPLAEQKAIAAILEPFDAQTDLLMRSLSSGERLKSALMSDLLTGRKRVTDALPLAAE